MIRHRCCMGRRQQNGAQQGFPRYHWWSLAGRCAALTAAQHMAVILSAMPFVHPGLQQSQLVPGILCTSAVFALMST